MAQIGDLRVFHGKTGHYDELPSSSTKYLIAEAIIKLGLSILESPEGKGSLVQVAQAILREGSQSTRFSHIYRDSPDNMPYWIGKFLTSMRGNFPTVYISANVQGEAEAERYEWGRDMRSYDAGVAGNIYLSKVMIDNMLFARENCEIAGDTYNLLKFEMGVSVAHEIVHLLTGFLTGGYRPVTPREVALEAYAEGRKGEAGRYWEGILLGGVVESWTKGTDIMGVRQAGTHYLFETGSKRSNGWRVSKTYINRFINGDFSFPIQASNPEEVVTRGTLENAGYSKTALLRRRAMRAPPAGSPAPDHPSANMAYRRLPAEREQYYSQSRRPTEVYTAQSSSQAPPYPPYPSSSSNRYYDSQPEASTRPYYQQSGGPSQFYDPYPRR
ncbi:hypothetical protein F53441_12692 [Fusarium austroafricanum]|uniref:Uncharacterized protein n=1 Tax=Fusarium austroafricanum TaxID=2364996 RepID=A0A8H4NNY3_9HYPO|nr:hypothetical protein F53441_12692 [Fusarium austroafricanum]